MNDMSQTTVNLGYVPKNRGEYSSTASYYKDNIVQYNGSSYICNPPNYDPDTAPTASITGVAPYASDPAVPNTGWAVFANDASGMGEGVYNVSEDHTTDGKPKVYATLSQAIADVPQAKQKGGISIKFIQGSAQSSDNKYVQYRLMSDDWSTDTEDWAISDEGVYVENPEFVEVHVDGDRKILWGVNTDGNFFFGAGCPKQVKEYIEAKIAELDLDSVDDILNFLGTIEGTTLAELLNGKVDKVEGESLIDEDFAEDVPEIVSVVDNPEYMQVEIDEENKVLGGRKADGTKVENMPIELSNVAIAKLKKDLNIESLQPYIGNIIKSYYVTGYIQSLSYVNGNVKVIFYNDSSVIGTYLLDGTSNFASIAANSEFLLGNNKVLVFDTTEIVSSNKIRIKNVDEVTSDDLILIKVMLIDENYARTITGVYANRTVSTSQYEEYNTHNVKQVYVRTVDRKSADVSNENVDFSMLISTDLHTNTQGTVQDVPTLNVKSRIDKNLNPNVVIDLGDTVGLGLSDNSRAFYSLNNLKQNIDTYINTFFVVGNHDYNNLSSASVDRQPKSAILPHKAIYNILGKLHEDDVVWGSKDGMYYYKDIDDKKIRLIVLNTLDKPEEWVTVDGVEYEKYPWLPNIVSADQIDWFIDTALDFTSKGADKTNWSVIVCSHVTPVPNAPGNEASLGALDNSNPQGAEICKIVEAFVAGTSKALSYTDILYGGNATLNRNADFTSQGAMSVIGWFSGHSHHDYKVEINGVTYITTLCGYYTSGVDEHYIEMEPNTYSEFALDLLVVDKSNRIAKLKRYGAGEDRSWTY